MTHSYWQEAPLLHHPLKTDFNHDIVIVGAGIAGLTTAYALSEKGFNPVIIDKFSPDSGETHYTSAHLASVIDDRFIHIEKWHGKKGAQLAYQSHAAAIDFIEKIVKRYDIDCDFKRLNGYLFSQKKEASFFLQKELLASWRAGHREVNLMTSIPLKGFEGATALRFPYQAQFEPARYMLGLLKVLQQRGLQIFSDTQIENWEEKNDKILLTTSRGIKIRCNQVIFACNEPFVRFRYFTLQAPYRTYALVFEVPEAIVHDGLYWDTEDPYHYIRFATKEGSPQEHVLIVGGEDHKTGQNPHTDEQWEKLEHWTR
ncbi:MAG: FAD-dependent oxidoreductase, partial [Verrucomicrobiota bacterium]